MTEPTDIPLREHLERLIADERARSDDQYKELRRLIDSLVASSQQLDRAHSEAHTREHVMNDQAIVKAYETMEKRLESMNEFRDQLRDQAATFVRREVLDTAMTGLTQRIEKSEDVFENRIARLELANANMTGRLTALGIAMGIIVVVVNVALRFL